ncbi:zinc-dependent metalloprotease [Tenacibaculum finnmarkense genomovar finnmarkense]|uniref:zinc-dependent metalloprotease n=1 Tax=Tenacibaculum finnmarkense TaxID=2781243 RepID=UPI001E30D1B5|nr:zinc-dependent metalloprotease [Tenacibaculum finnmarkense]MCD8416393.1 zinc-dependent metalloprotease [Tenacibaculum finnmarkense genomovar finnmarkense]MCG8185054.1 zinc-dependent metalloprotease [Tenacibaculum finnmarkense genomovar finnmarkense]MCG8201112.1 zinc-dependent metalloprotease [Tenacibaculum finnmarkense genomovar finnmarkense]MCG8209013.1 zinc-dependent metalloprotease [Tenacibaculum finnmarkense genomovar finnmarkense]MCG8211672.1 zinc-dependent metalloprotease [Tenacibacul
MIKKIFFQLLLVVFCISFSSKANAQWFKKKKNKKEISKAKPKPDKNAIKPYSKVVTEKFSTDNGLFKVHQKEQQFLFEIPDSLLNREMLMVTRIAKTASGVGFGGGKQNTQVLRWQKKQKNILLKVVSYNVVADSLLPVHKAVVNSNFEPILYSFPIKAFSKDSTATVIDVSSLFKTDVKAIGFPQRSRKEYKISKMDAKRSYIERISSYPKNIEVRHVKTYVSSAAPANKSVGAISMELSNSMILLPKKPMKRRYFDQRVGWFARSQTDYGLDAQKSKSVKYLDRWRLEVKEQDLEKFNNGELVEPKKQIIYYIDDATPKQWRKYIKQGINDWQVAFEAAGFKNAIIAKDAPTKQENPDWSPEDVRYSVVRYLASPIPNANGPHVSDPRSGEILESDVNWYHNVMTLLHDWYFIQTAAINPDARSMEFKEETMGRLIRFVSSHEVGHTLGLPHNMGSSVAYPVDSLRSASFTKKYGTAPSIMDYARFNYIAQPEDKGVALMPNIGLYDKYAISWGYRPIVNTSAKDEKKTLNKWILDKADNPIYRFGHQQVVNVIDPSSQTEDLGDDAIKASAYGIKNLQRILPNLEKWTTKDGENYDELKTMYGQLLGQFNRYMGHVSSNIGGVYENYKTSNQNGAVYTHVSKNHQKNALKFVNEQLFNTPNWLLDKNIFDKIQFSGADQRIRKLQTRTLNRILKTGRMTRLIENETLNGAKAYTLVNMMQDLRKGIWSELYSRKTIDAYRRNLQRAHLDRLDFLLNKAKNQKGHNNGGYFKQTAVNISQSDIKSVVRGELKRLKTDSKRALSIAKNNISRYHLQDVLDRINTILEPK